MTKKEQRQAQLNRHYNSLNNLYKLNTGEDHPNPRQSAPRVFYFLNFKLYETSIFSILKDYCQNSPEIGRKHTVCSSTKPTNAILRPR